MICVEIDIKAELVRLAEPEYAVFSRRLLPGTENVLGVRLPLLRRLARRIAKGDWAAYLDTAGDGSFEEVMLQGMVIGAICAPPQEVLARTAAFVPKIDNWSVCDSFCSGLKLARTHPEPVWEFLQSYFEDPRPFAVRFAVAVLLHRRAASAPRACSAGGSTQRRILCKNGCCMGCLHVLCRISRRDAALAASRAAGRIYLPQDHPENL